MQHQRRFTVIEVTFSLMILLLLCIFGWHLYSAAQTKYINIQFSKLAQTTLAYYEDQTKSLNTYGNENDLVKTCYQTQQTDFYNGRLACGIKVQRLVKVTANRLFVNSLIDRLSGVTKNEGFTIDNALSESNAEVIRFTAKTSIDKSVCTIFALYNPGANNPTANTSLTYNLDCSGFATNTPPGFKYVPLR